MGSVPPCALCGGGEKERQCVCHGAQVVVTSICSSGQMPPLSFPGLLYPLHLHPAMSIHHVPYKTFRRNRRLCVVSTCRTHNHYPGPGIDKIGNVLKNAHGSIFIDSCTAVYQSRRRESKRASEGKAALLGDLALLLRHLANVSCRVIAQRDICIYSSFGSLCSVIVLRASSPLPWY